MSRWTKAQEKENNRAQVCIHMHDTAIRNGKTISYTEICDLASRLHRMETTLTRLAEDECNYGSGNYAEEKQERIENLAEKLIKENIGCECYTQRDPRGFCIRMYLFDKDGNNWYNTWGGDVGLNW